MLSAFFKFALFASCVLVPSVYAATFTPTSYTATPGQGTGVGGGFNYFDDGGTQLTDGIIGVNEYTTNLGNGNAFEWVGWLAVNPTLTFNFASSVTLTDVIIGFNRNQGAGIFLPPTLTINGTNFNLIGTEVVNNARGFLTFSGNFVGPTITINLIDNITNRWIFIDEVQFQGPSAAIPEPSLTLGILALGASLWHKKRTSR